MTRRDVARANRLQTFAGPSGAPLSSHAADCRSRARGFLGCLAVALIDGADVPGKDLQQPAVRRLASLARAKPSWCFAVLDRCRSRGLEALASGRRLIEAQNGSEVRP